MSQTLVVHCRRSEYDIYIGRPRGGARNEAHFGNPFSPLPSSKAPVRLGSREGCLVAFREWLAGTAHQSIEPERRVWILANLHTLKGKRLGCWCSPQSCHGDILAELAEEA